MGDAIALVVVAVALLAGGLALVRVQIARQAAAREQRELDRKRQQAAEQDHGHEMAELSRYTALVNGARTKAQLDQLVQSEQERRTQLWDYSSSLSSSRSLG